jgi:hypothetical protein
MTTAARTIARRLTVFTLAFAALSAPASASMLFSYCSSGCSTTGGSYSSWQTGTGSSGLVFSGSPITFSAGGLASGIYTDGSGTGFTGYSNSSTATTDSLTLNGAALAQTTNGKYSGIQITLPSNTYAFAMILSTVSNFGDQAVEVNGLNLDAANFVVGVPSGGTQFFGFLSDTPITSIFVGNTDNFSGKLQINSFELGESGGGGSDTPETSSLVSIGTGLVFCGLLRRRGRIQKPNRFFA